MRTPVHVILDGKYGPRFKEILNDYGLQSYALRYFARRLVELHDDPKYKDKPMSLIKDATNETIPQVLETVGEEKDETSRGTD